MRREFFKIIEEFPNYEVSNQGRVRNIRTGSFMVPFCNPTNGWYFVDLRRGRVKRTIPLQRLVAEAFLEPPAGANLSILQRDGDRANNRADNLAWKPRWFVVMYMREMSDESYHRRESFVSEYTGEIFDSVAHVASTVLLLPSEVFEAAYGYDIISFPRYGRIIRLGKNLSYSQALRGL